MSKLEGCGRGGSHACLEYDALSRRRFMAISGSAAAAIASAPAWLPRVAYAKDHRGSMRDVLICVFLRGGSDGLSMVVPYAENAYYANRPTLAVPQPDSGLPNSALDLGAGGAGMFGLNPALAALMPAYSNGHLLAVHATGSTDPTRSHFDAQKFMEIGKPADPSIGTGWLGRHLYSVSPMAPDALLRAVGIGTGLQLALSGGPLTLPIPNLDAFGLRGFSSSRIVRRTVTDDMYDNAGGDLGVIANNTLATIDLLNTIDFSGYAPAGGAVYPANNIGNAFKSVAALIKAEAGVEAVAIDSDAWDTHSNQGSAEPGGAMWSLMSNLAAAMGAFYADLTATPAAPGFIVEVQSEFGRRIAENGAGTDHGHGNALFLMGPCIGGGRVLTRWPGLAPEQLFEGLDLQVTIDYRSILAEIVQRRLGNDNLAYVFPDYTPTFENVTTC